RIIIKSPEVHNIRRKGQGFTEQLVRKFAAQPGGAFKFIEFQNGIKKREGTSRSKIPLILNGKITEYHPNGNLKSRSVYKNNELVSNENWTSDGDKYIDNVFYSVDQEPRYLPGTAYLHNHVLKTFRESKIDLSQLEGRIVVGFVVMEDGGIEGIRIEEGMGSTLNNLAIRSMETLIEQWQPARLNGEYVRFYQLFPINFIYNKVDFDNLELKGSMLYWEMN
ncbi:MAG: energy transducer TonB, partial [Mariniphaga sp.]